MGDSWKKVKARVFATVFLTISPMLHAQVTNAPSTNTQARTASPQVIVREDPIPGIPAGPVRPATSFPPGLSNAPAAMAAPPQTSPEERRLQELLKLQFDRRAISVLQALAKQADSANPTTNEAQRFQLDVVAGDWRAVGAFLKKLPEKHAPQVFNHVLRQLPITQPQMGMPPGAGSAPGPGVVMTPVPGGMPAGPIFFPDDVLEIAEAMPGDLTEEQVELLGRLLSQAFVRGNFSEPFLERLQAGTTRLGGDDAKKRSLAVTLLIAANRLTDAGKFLPSLQAAIEKKEIKTLELHARYLTALGREQQKSDALRQSWEITQLILSATNSAALEKEQALRRSLELMPLLSKEMGTNWLRESFQKRPEQGMAILAAMGGLVAQNVGNRDVEQRRRNLELQRMTVEALLEVVGGRTRPWETALNLLAVGWLQEADYAKTRYVPQRNIMPQFDPYGNQIFYGGPRYGPGFQDPSQLPPVSIDQLLPTAPSEAWLAVLDKTLRPRVWTVLAELNLKNEEERKALPYIEILARDYGKAASVLANDLLRSWAQSHNPNQQNFNQPRYYYGPYGMQQAAGISLTRAMQQRNLAELADVLQRLRSFRLDSLDDRALVGAFSASHSMAEVFRVEDMETVFGPIDGMKSDTLAELLQTMRQRLAGQWRQPMVQQQAKTKRSDKEIDAEIVRGYQLVAQLAERGLRKRPGDWRMNLVHGAVMFDWAEFDYGKKVDLAIYIEKRDRAFKAFAKSAELYALRVPYLDEKDQTPFVYQQWFNATLGASDLAYLTRQQDPNTNHLDKIRRAILELPGEAGERHLAGFSKAFSESANGLKPELKPRYLRAGLRVAGGHSSADEARKLVTYYDDLLQEIYLDVRVDGDAAVGYNQPFGVFIAIRHTEALGRESGGFGKYLQNQQNSQYFYSPYGQAPVNYRDDFEKQVREKWGPGFEILSVTFQDDKVQPRGYGRPEWRETPYAYVLLKAKDAATDRLPTLQLDLDFLDKRGQVVLPITSQVQLIDARPASVRVRPAEKLTVQQILDDRQLTKGQLALEIKASTRGLVPELKDLVETNVVGFVVEKIEDQGLAVTKLDSDGDALAALSERNWVIKLRPESADHPVATFHFPKAKIDGIDVAYKHYADADLVDVKADLALAGLALQPTNPWRWILGGAASVLIAVLLFLLLRKSRKAAPTETLAPYALPAHITPFTVLNLLRRMQQDHQLALGDERRHELAETIRDLEKHFFGRAEGNGKSVELHQIARQWVGQVRARP